MKLKCSVLVPSFILSLVIPVWGGCELDCPARSPNFNLIQHLWDKFDCCSRSRLCFTTSHQCSWEKIPADIFQNLVETSRVERTVISAKWIFFNPLFMNCFLTFYKLKGRSIKTKYFCSTVHVLLATSPSWNLEYSNARRVSSLFLYPCKTCSQKVVVERWH